MNAFRWPGTRPQSLSHAQVMFPNGTRSLDSTQTYVSFWGYASTVELTFQMASELLRQMSGAALDSEASLLRVFDANRTAIEEAAASAYGRHHVTFCRLESTDFQTRVLAV